MEITYKKIGKIAIIHHMEMYSNERSLQIAPNKFESPPPFSLEQLFYTFPLSLKRWERMTKREKNHETKTNRVFVKND